MKYINIFLLASINSSKELNLFLFFSDLKILKYVYEKMQVRSNFGIVFTLSSWIFSQANDIVIDKTGSNTNDTKVIKQVLQNVIFQDSLNIDLYIIIYVIALINALIARIGLYRLLIDIKNAVIKIKIALLRVIFILLSMQCFDHSR